MAAPGHRRRRRTPVRERVLRTALPGLGVAAIAASTVAVVTQQDGPLPTGSASTSVSAASPAAPATTATVPPISRSDVRVPLDELPVDALDAVKGSRYATEALDVRVAPRADAVVVAEVKKGAKVRITGRTQGKYAEVVRDRTRRWVRAEYLSTEEPKEPAESDAPCPTGSAVEAGLRPATIAVHRAVCAAFPQITTYGGVRADGMHGQGRALDIMVSSDLGTEIAAFVREHAAELGVTEVIWRQRIWTTQLAGSGWRAMEDRGSPTANHMDHVHVTTGG